MRKHQLESILERAVAIAPLEMDSFDAQFHRDLLFSFNEEKLLSHYIRLDYFKCLLHAYALRFKRLDLYTDTDRYEGRFPAANATHEATVSGRLAATLNSKTDRDEMIASQEVARQYCYIHCWFGQESESRPMWECYGDHGRGVCIRSSTSLIRRSVSSPGSHIHFHAGKVTYSDEATPIGTIFSLAPAFRKHPDYRDESEYRLVAVIPSDYLPTDTAGYLAAAPAFQPIPVSLSELVAEILIGPECSVDQIAEVFELAHRYLPGAPVNASRFWRP